MKQEQQPNTNHDRPQSRKGKQIMKLYNVTFKWYDTDTYTWFAQRAGKWEV